MNQPQRWRGSPSSPLGAVIFVGMLLALLLTTSGCVHIAVLGAMTNAAPSKSGRSYSSASSSRYCGQVSPETFQPRARAASIASTAGRQVTCTT